MVGLAVLAGSVACGGKPAPAPNPVANSRPAAQLDAAPAASPNYTKLSGELAAFADAMCACKTKACAQKVSDDMSKWSASNETTHTSFDNLSPDEQTNVDDLGSRMGDCMQKIK